MANVNSPYGLQAIQLQGGKSWRDSVNLYYIPSTDDNAYYVGDPVIKVTNSADVNGVNAVTLATAGTANAITGVIVGFQGTGTALLGNYNPGSLFGLSGSPGPAYRPASTSLGWYVLVNDDPSTLYAVQSNDSGGVPAAGIVGRNANLASGTGSNYTGWSGWELAVNTVGTGSTLQVQIKGALTDPTNLVGSANCKFIVQINDQTEQLPHAGI